MSGDRYPTTLFTRLQVAEMTRIDPSTLNYWMREGLLRPAEGGAGRGSHRRFPYQEITLAALLNELRGFGINTPTLGRLAKRFHDAWDWMTQRGISYADLNDVFSLYLVRKEVVRHGCWSWQVSSAEELGYFQAFDQETDEHGRKWVDLDWEQAVAFQCRPRSGRSSQSELPSDAIALVGSWNSEEDFKTFRHNMEHFEAIAAIDFREPRDAISADPHYFYRDERGDLVMTSVADTAGLSTSFIGVDVDRLTYGLWALRP